MTVWKRWSRGVGAAVCVSLACMSGAFADSDTAPIVVIDDRGVRVELDAPAARVVSLLPSLTESVCALGACERLVGTDRYSDWPDAVALLPKIGGFEDVQVERLYALRPDVVLAAESTRVIDRLESLGLTVVALEPRSLDDSRRAVALIGTLLGLKREAAALIDRIDSAVAAAAKDVPAEWRGARAYFEVSSTPHAAGEVSFIGEVLDSLGLANIVPASMGPFPPLNPEFVVRAQPDLILGSAGAVDSMEGRPGWSSLLALQRGHQCGFDELRHDVLVRPGPRLGEAAQILADCLASLPQRVLSDQ